MKKARRGAPIEERIRRAATGVAAAPRQRVTASP
jgi:hypothetical protein